MNLPGMTLQPLYNKIIRRQKSGTLRGGATGGGGGGAGPALAGPILILSLNKNVYISFLNPKEVAVYVQYITT